MFPYRVLIALHHHTKYLYGLGVAHTTMALICLLYMYGTHSSIVIKNARDEHLVLYKGAKSVVAISIPLFGGTPRVYGCG